MEKLIIEPTEDTPKIVFDTTADAFELSGKSYPDNVFSFYDPVLDWLNRYSSAPLPVTKFIFKLDYFNTASAKIIFDILSIADAVHAKGHQVAIAWYYKNGDDDMKEAGEEYQNIIEASIELIGY